MFIFQPTSCAGCGHPVAFEPSVNNTLCTQCCNRQMLPKLDYPFTANELQRLVAYRAAVRAGFFSDYPPLPANRG